MGETAPLLILGPYTKVIATDLFSGYMPTLPTMINQDRSETLQPAVDRMWAAALTLILLVLVLNLVGRLVARFSKVRRLTPQVFTERRRTPMAKRIDVKDLNVYYGVFKAVEGVTMTVEPRSVTAFIGPSGCGKSTFLRTLNRMHEVIPGGRVEGKVALDDQDLYAAGVDPVAVRRTVGMVFQRPNPFPTMSIYDNVAAGLRLNGVKNKKLHRRDRGAVAARREPLERGQGPAGQARRGPVRRPAAAALHRPRDRRRAAGAADGRAVLGARPDLDAGDRGPDQRAQEPVHDRHRHPQHAAGGAGVATGRRSSTSRRPASPAG